MPYKTSDSLCWDCQNAVPNKEGRGCSWSRYLRPVEGWKAKTRVISSMGNGVRPYVSYNVRECPEFIWDKEKEGDGFMTRDELEKKLAKTERRLQDCIDELCFKCGAYRGDASKLKCDTCKWEELKGYGE